MLNRRRLLKATAGLAVIGLNIPARATEIAGFDARAIRGSIDVSDFGIRAAAFDDQSRAFQDMLAGAADRGAPVFLPPGTYAVSNVTLPKRLQLTGVPGATRIVYGGDGHLFVAEDASHVEIAGVVLDGANRWLGDHAQGLVDFRRVSHAVLDNCQVTGSTKNGIAFEKVSGRIERSLVSGAADAGIYSVEAGRVEIVGNSIADCSNGGILVHRWRQADDGTIVRGNRIERIAARSGGTGQNGNGINTFRADNVIVAGNSVSACAFSAVRANSSSNLQVTGNTCLASGETAIYAEFAFEGAVIGSNIVEGAANGISIVNFDSGGRLGVCTGNIVRNLLTEGPYPADAPGFGVGISVEADTTVTGNVVENAPLYGIRIGWGPFMRNVVATGNVLRQAGTGIAVTVIECAGPAVISDNMISGSRLGAILGYRWARPVTGELAPSGDGGYAHLTVERNRLS